MGWLSVIAVIVVWGHATQGCTIVKLDSSGFASNAYSLLHALPIFYRRNGTFFLDNSDFHYRCSEDGGWHEFFSGEDKIVPWSRPKELVHGPDCARYTREDVDQIMYNIVQTKPEPLDFIGIKMVRLSIVKGGVSVLKDVPLHLALDCKPPNPLQCPAVCSVIKSAGHTSQHMITSGVSMRCLAC